MKQILTFSIAILSAAMYFTGCETDLNSNSGAPDLQPMAAGSSADAHPAIAFRTIVTSKNKNYSAIAVMDSDGTDQAVIYTLSATTDSNSIFPGPCWSPDGGSVAFYIYGRNVSDGIVLRDVSVSHGKAVGSNTRTIYTPDTGYVRGLSWCSLSSTDKIAFTTLASGSGSRLYTIASSGGTPTLIYQSNTANGLHFYDNPTWSPDDSKIAFVDRAHSSGIDTLRVVSVSTGELLASIPLGATYTVSACIEWSRTGLNQIVLGIDYTNNQTYDAKLYYVTPTEGSTLTTDNVNGADPTWSPNNSFVASIVYGSSSTTLQKTATGGTTTTTIATGKIWNPNWKQ